MILATEEHMDAILELYDEIIALHAEIEPEFFITGQQSREFIENTIKSEESDILLALKNNQVVGFSMVKKETTPPYPMLKPRKYAYLLDLIVAEKQRGQGFGKQLLNDSIAWQKNNKLEYLELCVIEANNYAKKLYESFGFETYSRQMIIQ